MTRRRSPSATKRRPATERRWPRLHPRTEHDQAPAPPPAAEAVKLGPVAVALGRRIQQHRLAAQLTQGELARRTGLSRGYVGQLERGEANITLDKLERFARAIGWDLAKTLSVHQPLTLNDSARKLLHTHLTQLARYIDEMIRWLDALDPTHTPLNFTDAHAPTPPGLALRARPFLRRRP